MRSRFAIVLAAIGLVAALPAAGEARAADQVVARDTLIRLVYPLDGDLVYRRILGGPKFPRRSWMASFSGRVHPARGIPPDAYAGGIGRDAEGRKVLPFNVPRRNGDALSSSKWFVYDLARNRARRLRGLPLDCVVGSVALWRGRTAYEANCKTRARSGLFLRQGKRRQRLQEYAGGGRLVLRGGTLAEIFDDGADDFWVQQWMANGKPCAERINASWGDATSETGWYPDDLWTSNGNLIWTMGDFHNRADFAILTAKVNAGCTEPGPVGLLPFSAETASVRALAVDGRRVLYADDETLRSHLLPAKAIYDVPANDDFENAQELDGDAPVSATGRAAYATLGSGEPLADTTGTVWYAFRPTHSGTVDVQVDGACSTALRYCGTFFRFGVYTGARPGALTQVGESSDYSTHLRAVAGQTYWIDVGSRLALPNFKPFTVRVGPSPYP
jgi:hypothetical protein